jgi:hypothetical protein
MELDKALQFAVTVSWDDLMKAGERLPVRVEYQGSPGVSLDHVSVWSAKAWGYHDLLCDYWTSASSGHPNGASFKNGLSSDKLAAALGFIMKNQDQFRRPLDAGGHGLVLIDPPALGDREEAVNWINQVRGSDTSFSTAH